MSTQPKSLADRVMFDMSSMGGPEPALVAAESIIEGWEKGLRAMKAIHHQSTAFGFGTKKPQHGML